MQAQAFIISSSSHSQIEITAFKVSLSWPFIIFHCPPVGPQWLSPMLTEREHRCPCSYRLTSHTDRSHSTIAGTGIKVLRLCHKLKAGSSKHPGQHEAYRSPPSSTSQWQEDPPSCQQIWFLITCALQTFHRQNMNLKDVMNMLKAAALSNG